jgi:hypothetical protein
VMGITTNESRPAAYNTSMQAMTVSPQDRRSIRRHDVPSFRITPRIVAILAALDRFGILTSQQIARLDGGSHQKVLRILKRCFDAGLVDHAGSSAPPLTPFFDARPLCYALSRKGARVLADAGVPVNVSLDRTTKNKRAVLLQHTVDVAETMLFGFHAACAIDGAIRLIDQHDLALPSATAALRKPFYLRTDVHPADFPHLGKLLKEPIELGAEPDRLFNLAKSDNTGWGFALELDRGTMDVSARSLRKATFFRKQLAYYAAWIAGRHTEQWGPAFKAFRVLTVTTSDARIQHMIEQQRAITQGANSGLFLYSTPDRISASGAFGAVWTSSTGDRISLLNRE